MIDEFTREYSQRLGTLTGAQLQGALDRFGLGTLLEARAAPGGLFGQNVLLRSTAGSFVLRGAPHYDGQFERERFFSRAVHEHTQAEAPWPFLIERSPGIFGWSFALMPAFDGLHLGDGSVRKALSPDERVALAAAMGAYLAQLHAGDWDAPADYDYAADALAPMPTGYGDWFSARTRSWLAAARAASPRTTDDDVAWIEALISAAMPALDAGFRPALVHTDYSEGNVIVACDAVSGAWSVQGVFDLGDAFIGDGEYDLARLACLYQRAGEADLAAFMESYLRVRPPRPGFDQRMRLYIAADRLIIWEYGQRMGVWFDERQPSFRAWCEQSLLEADRWSPV